mgnify:CR=1 FL=1
MQTVIVAGGAGFIGAHLCESLLSEGYRVICVDNFLTSKEEKLKNIRNNSNFSFINHDVTKPLEISEKIDYIFHLASPASPNHHSKISYHALPEETMHANTTGTFNLLRLAEKNNATFLFASSSEIYGDPKENPQNEEYRGNVSTTGPRSVYDEAKSFGETITAYFGRDKGVDARIARIFNTFGPGMLPEDMRMVIVFITQALNNEPISIFGDGSQTRSLCYVSDTVEGLKKFMFTPNLNGEIINIGSNEEHSVRDFANLIKKHTGSVSEVKISEELPKDDPLARKPDIEKAKRLLGWSPKVPLDEGLVKTIQYFKSL